MQRIFKCLLAILVSGAFTVSGQVSPYSLNPNWYFGIGGKLTFGNGNFPTSTAPTPGFEGKLVQGIENSTGMSFQDGALAFYTNTMRAYDANPAKTHFSQSIRNFFDDGTCAGSSTGGALAFPDPASPTNAFYLILSTDMTGGSCANSGINRYRLTGTGVNVTVNSGPINMDPTAWAGEAITGCTDGTGGYWVIVHNRTSTNEYRVWHFTSSGITGPTTYSGGAAVSSVVNTQSYLKMSPCQDKIAYVGGGFLVVNAFNKTTGEISTELRRHVISPSINGVGLEFSPDGSKVFYSADPGQVRYINSTGAASPAVDVTGTGPTTSWSMQLGPDGNIYTSPFQGATQVGVIINANTLPTFTNPIDIGTGGSIYRGLVNMTWLSPDAPTITSIPSACSVDFMHEFQNYFQANITTDPTKFTWNFGDGNSSNNVTATHTYAASGTYTVSLTFEDATCHHTWVATKEVTVSCSTQPCSDGTTPTSVQADRDNFCADDAGNIILSATTGTSLEWFSDAGATTSIGTGNNLSIASPATTTTYYVRSTASGAGCNPSALASVTVTVRPLPTPSVNGTTFSACQNTTGLTFSTTNVAGHSYTWNVTGGLTITAGGNTNSVTVDLGTTNGTISVTEQYSSGSACPVTTSASTVTVISSPTPSVNGPTSVCPNTTGLTFSTTNVSGHNYSWNATGGLTITAGGSTNQVTVSVGATGGTLTVTEDVGGQCAVSSSAFTVTISSTPVAAAGSDQSLCITTATGSTTLNASPATGTWSSANGTILFSSATNAAATVSGLPLGSTTLTWTPAGCGGVGTGTPDDVVITVTSKPTPDITGLTSVCEDSIAIYSVTDNGNDFVWVYTGDGSATGLTTDEVTVTMGTATGKLVVTETSAADAGCVGKDSVEFTLVVVTPEEASAGSDINPCISSNINLSGNLPLGFTGLWTLTSGTGSIDSPSQATTEVDITGAATFTWTINGRCGYQDSDNITVTHVTSSSLLANTGDQDDTLCDGSTADLSAYATGGSGDYSYHWFTNKGEDFAVEQDSVLSGVTPPLGTTVYYVEVSDDQAQGCPTAIDSVILYSTNSQELIIPNLVTPNGDEKNDIFELRDAVSDHELFPGSTLLVTNRWGDTVYRNTNYDNKWTPSSLADGVYYYYLETGCGKKEYKGWVHVVR